MNALLLCAADGRMMSGYGGVAGGGGMMAPFAPHHHHHPSMAGARRKKKASKQQHGAGGGGGVHVSRNLSPHHQRAPRSISPGAVKQQVRACVTSHRQGAFNDSDNVTISQRAAVMLFR